MPTALDQISRALREVGELAAGETADGNYAEDCKDVLNAMLDQWSLEDLLLWYEKTEEFDLVAGQEAYTIGETGADFTAVRPIEILGAWLRDGNALDTKLGVVSNDTYQSIVQKETTNTLPRVVSYNPNYPLGELKVWPSPTSGLKLRVTGNKLLTRVTNLDDEMSLPPGFEEAIVYGLAKRLAPGAGRLDILNVYEALESDAKANIKRKNLRMDLMSFDPNLYGRRRGSYNPWTDE